MNRFKDLRDSGFYDDTDPLQVECLRFCYYGVLQVELSEVAVRWNHHSIRRSRNAEGPAGRPEILYVIPGEAIKNYKLSSITATDILVARSFTKKSSVFGCKKEFAELAFILMKNNGFTMPKSREDAERLYFNLLHLL